VLQYTLETMQMFNKHPFAKSSNVYERFSWIVTNFGYKVIPLFWKSPTIPHHFQNTKSHKYGNFMSSDNDISWFEPLLSKLSFRSFSNSMVGKLWTNYWLEQVYITYT